MRPTQIGLPLPTQKTPAPYAVQSTNRGDALGPNLRTFARKGSFSKCARFSQYKEWARRTGPIGPGAYAVNVRSSSSCKVRFTPPSKQAGAGLYMVGSLQVHDPDFDGCLVRSVTSKQTTKPRFRSLALTKSFFAMEPDLPKLPRARLRRRLKQGHSRSSTPAKRTAMV
jgi:hypothetical protein